MEKRFLLYILLASILLVVPFVVFSVNLGQPENTGTGNEDRSTAASSASESSTTASNSSTEDPGAKGSTSEPTVAENPEIVRNIAKTDADLSGSSGYLAVSLVIISVVALLSTTVAAYLYRWRRVVLGQTQWVVPEQFNSWLLQVDRALERNSDFTKEKSAKIIDLVDRTRLDNTDLVQTLQKLQETITSQEQEIKSLRRVHDNAALRRVLVRFIRVDQALTHAIQEDAGADALQDLKPLIEDAFDEAGIDRLKPSVGDDYRKAFGVANNPKIIETQDKEKHFAIGQVLEDGYYLRGAQDAAVLVPAKVVVYKAKGAEAAQSQAV